MIYSTEEVNSPTESFNCSKNTQASPGEDMQTEESSSLECKNEIFDENSEEKIKIFNNYFLIFFKK